MLLAGWSCHESLLVIIKSPQHCQKQVNSSPIRIYDGATVLKSSLAFYLHGCDSKLRREYKSLERESVTLLEWKKRNLQVSRATSLH